MQMGLSDKRALVTGSSTGLGRAIAEMLAAEGASVVVHGRDEQRTHHVVDGIRLAGGDAAGVIGDIATAEGAAELAGTGVTANIVAPGAIRTGPTEEMARRAAAEHGWGSQWIAIEKAASTAWFPNDVGRFGRPEEVAAAVTFLASTHADYITGADLRVDGGVVRTVS